MNVLAFPEGTTTRGNVVRPFRRGVFGAARIAGVSVVPIAVRLSPPELCWVDDDLFLPHYLKAAMRTRTVVQLDFGAAINARSFSSAEALARAARQAIRHRLGLCTSTDSTEVALTRAAVHARRTGQRPAGMERYARAVELVR
jgi:1-acyl-sn-glycerol-3-phosphate acyltransferase